MNAKSIRDYIIIPTLMQLKNRFSYNDTVLRLVMETMYHESNGFSQIIQQPNNGPAYGLCQMEGDTFRWLQKDWISKWPEFVKISPTYPNIPFTELLWNLKLNVAMCRARYYVDKRPLPVNTLEARSDYWYKIYNASGVLVRKHHYQIHAKELDKLLL